MKRHHFSIRTLLLIVISILNLLIAGPLGYLAYKSFINYNNAADIRYITDTLHYLYTTKKNLALERASTLALLYVPPDAVTTFYEEIEESRQNSQETFNHSQDLLESADAGVVSDALQDVKATYSELHELRHKLDTAVFSAGRDNINIFSDLYFKKITELNKKIDRLIEAYSSQIVLFDPEITRLMRQTRLIWEISEYASQEYALIGRLIAQNRFPDGQTREQLIALRGRIKYGFEIAQGSIAASRWKKAVAPSLEEARTHYLMIFEQVKDVFYQPAAPAGPILYPVSVEMWLQLASEAVNSLHDMTDAALEVNSLYVMEIERNAKRSIYFSLLLFGSALALSIYTWWLITARIVKPVNAMVEALYKETKPTSHDREKNESLDEITKLGEVLEVFRESLHQLERERDKAQAANIAKSEFLANMSHEIRTPMNVVVGLSNILERTRPLTDKQQEFIKTLQISADSLLSLINDLLDFSKIETHNFELEKTPFNLEELLLELTRIKNFKSQERGLEFIADIKEVTGKEYIGDPTRLRQIIVNLCGNAIKFTETGSVILRVTSAPNKKKGYETLKIEVIDTGIGIADNKLDLIFDKFTQADASIVRKYGGTGLGLAITKSLVEMMDGEIGVKSIYGEGTVFKVELPLLLQAPQYSSYAKPAKAAKNKNARSANKILLVEDYAPNALVAGTLLEEFGYEYDIAENGKDAVQKYMENDYSTVLMDIQMPGMDGLEATKAIREYERETGAKKVKIIGLTAHASVQDRDKCLEAGMNDYIAKPFNADELEAKL